MAIFSLSKFTRRDSRFVSWRCIFFKLVSTIYFGNYLNASLLLGNTFYLSFSCLFHFKLLSDQFLSVSLFSLFLKYWVLIKSKFLYIFAINSSGWSVCVFPSYPICLLCTWAIVLFEPPCKKGVCHVRLRLRGNQQEQKQITETHE